MSTTYFPEPLAEPTWAYEGVNLSALIAEACRGGEPILLDFADNSYTYLAPHAVAGTAVAYHVTRVQGACWTDHDGEDCDCTGVSLRAGEFYGVLSPASKPGRVVIRTLDFRTLDDDASAFDALAGLSKNGAL